MFCKNCGKQGSDSDKFCSQCGSAVQSVLESSNDRAQVPESSAEAVSVGETSASETTNTEVPEQGSNVKKLMPYFLGAVAVMLIGYYFFSYLPKQNEIDVRQSCDDETRAWIRAIYANDASYRPLLSGEKLDNKVNIATGSERYKTSYEICLSKNGIKP